MGDPSPQIPATGTLPDLVRHASRRDPDHPALLASYRQAYSHARLCHCIDSTIGRLNGLGVNRQDRVAVVLPGGMEILAAFLSVGSFAVFAPLNPDCTDDEFEFCLRACNAKFLLTHAEFDTRARAAAQRLGLTVLEITHMTDQGLVFGDAPAGNPAVPHPQAAPEDIALLLHTSGTTATPKLVPLSHANLLAAVDNIVSSLSLDRNDCCLNMLPPFHVGALVDLLLAPLAAGGSIAVAEDAAPETFYRHLLEFRPTWVQAVPTMLHDIVRHRSATAERFFSDPGNNRLRFIRSVSSALPESLRREVEAVFRVPVIEIYGMSETAGVICSNPLDNPVPGSVGIPVAQQVSILDAEGNTGRPGRKGEVIVRGDNVFGGYETGGVPDHAANREAFIGPWFRTGDEGYFDGDGYLYLTGRIKEIINRGGEKVSPQEVDRIALSYPDVEEAAAFAVRHDSLGEDIALAVVSAKQGFDPGDLRKFLAERLARYKVPRKIVPVTSLPRNKSGKVLRGELSRLYGENGTGNNNEWIEPETELAADIAAWWRRVLNVDRVGMQDDFFELGGDSLSAVGFLTALREQYPCEIEITALYDHPSLAEFEAYLAGKLKQAGTESRSRRAGNNLPESIFTPLKSYLSAWRGSRSHADSLVVGLNTLGDKPPLFWCVQGYDELRTFSDALGRQQPVYGMRSLAYIPGKTDDHNEELAGIYADEILAIQPDGDYYIGGFCEGGKIAFETARALQSRGRHVALLCLHDKFICREYTGRIAFFFCRPTLSNPYGLYHEPEKGWRQFCRGPVSVYHFNMGHDYNDPALPSFTAALARELDNAASGRPPGNLLDLDEIASRVLPESAYRAGITVVDPVPRLMSPGQPLTLEIRIRNNSPETWPPGHISGLVLTNRWFNRRGIPRSDVDGRTVLTGQVGPGESISLPLTITAPCKSGARTLLIDLADEGVTWFHEKGSTPATCRLRILPGGRYLNRLIDRQRTRKNDAHEQD